MKLKNLFQFYLDYKAKKSRLKALKLALQTNHEHGYQVVDVAKKIHEYIYEKKLNY